MRMKVFGKTGRKISEIGMGTYYDPFWIATAFFGWRRGGGRRTSAIRAGLDGGITLVDTAEIYGSEPLVARAIKERKRDEIFLASKVWLNHLHREALLKAFNKSLRRLGVSYLDLYQVHFPNGRVPISETLGAMEDLVRDGKLGHIGVSNFTLRQIEEASSALSKYELTSVQLDYSLIHRNVEDSILPYCEKEGIALLAYYPLGHGKLASDPRLDQIASRYGKSKSQVALRWLARKDCVFPIPRASSQDHVTENLGASNWELSDGDLNDLKMSFK